jgi:hypothetical protein
MPDWDDRIGSSVDGLIVDENNQHIAILKIKVPPQIYKSLLRARPFKTHDCEHIPLTHYAQIQGDLAILNLEKCFYIVMGHHREFDDKKYKYEPYKIYIEEVDRNEKYWNTTLYPAINKFIT